jgi:hypothetical protein
MVETMAQNGTKWQTLFSGMIGKPRKQAGRRAKKKTSAFPVSSQFARFAPVATESESLPGKPGTVAGKHGRLPRKACRESMARHPLNASNLQ